MTCTVIKIGGRLVEDAASLGRLCDRLASSPTPLVVVHGGGVLADSLARSLGVETRVIDGRRVTDEATLRVTVMAYAGWVNKSIVAALQRRGINACGLSGCDGRVVTSRRRPAGEIDWGHVGDVERVDAGALSRLVERGIVPVLSPITLGDDGELLNTNADSVATAVAAALNEVTPTGLLFCLDQPGVLADAGDPSTLVPLLTRARYEEYRRDGIIRGGMLPKLENAFKALAAGVRPVRLLPPDDPWNGATGTTLAER
ncbi:MAG: acetylglutamate kinase [Odoribacteraceae bacterium]|jgi:acetylglutamate kinase|nr:acetylglutamate kinase [Odoribacteraceae bacterium]